MKKRIIILSVAAVLVLLLVASIFISNIMMPSVYINSQKKRFSNFELVSEISESDSDYYARYEMSLSEWQELLEDLSDYHTVSDSGNLKRGTMDPKADKMFTYSELENMTDVYYSTRDVRWGWAKNWVESVIAICPDGDTVSLYYSVYVHSANSK